MTSRFRLRFSFGLALSLTALTACSREAMEMSPEALRSYGLPSQSSHFDNVEREKKDKDTSVSWFDSSAIVSKKTVDY